MVQRDDFVWREWLSRQQFARRVRFRSGRMIHHDQLGGVKIEHLAQFLADLQDVRTVARPEHGFASEQNKLILVRVNEAIIRKTQTGRRRAQQVGHEAESFAVPGV